MFRLVFMILLSLSFSFAQECTKCHKSNQCRNMKHYTLRNAINITREAWGIKDSNVTLQTLPEPKKVIKKPSDLVDDFLRRKCLKCHLGVKNSGENGMKREKSCLACHQRHSEKGRCQTKKIPMKKCLSCHNKEFVGADYIGLFPKDHHHSFRAPLQKDGRYPLQKYGIDHHVLSQDIHYQKGMSCVDCHNSKNNKKWESGASCKECHKSLTKRNHKNYHLNIACSTCHSSWNINSYELSVFRDDTSDYKKWKNLTLQEDGYLNKFLTKALKSKKKIKPVMPDWVDMKLKKGIWYSGWRYRRWEDFILGNDIDGVIKILRPMFQYRVSYRDENGTMILDDVSIQDGKPLEAWTAYAPHTITKKAKSCEICHENRLILDNIKNGNILDLKIPKQIHNATLLNKEQIKKMRSKRYKKERFKNFTKTNKGHTTID